MEVLDAARLLLYHVLTPDHVLHFDEPTVSCQAPCRPSTCMAAPFAGAIRHQDKASMASCEGLRTPGCPSTCSEQHCHCSMAIPVLQTSLLSPHIYHARKTCSIFYRDLKRGILLYTLSVARQSWLAFIANRAAKEGQLERTPWKLEQEIHSTNMTTFASENIVDVPPNKRTCIAHCGTQDISTSSPPGDCATRPTRRASLQLWSRTINSPHQYSRQAVLIARQF